MPLHFTRRTKTIDVNVSDAVGQTIKPSTGRECKLRLLHRVESQWQGEGCVSVGDWGVEPSPTLQALASTCNIKRGGDQISILHVTAAALCRRGRVALRPLWRCFQV